VNEVEIGESVAVVVKMQKEGKCIICSKDHDKPKKDEIKPIAPGNSGWHRKTMTGIFESDGTREKVYSSGFPPSYSYQGHHCLALSAVVENANGGSPSDRRLRLNFFLDKVGFFPNRPRNVIGLPARKGIGDFKAFWHSVDGDHPLQMHGPGHDEAYFVRCERLLGRLVSGAADLCEESTQKEWEDQLRELAKQAENYAFKNLAHYDEGWQLHPAEQQAATRLYSASTDTTETVSGKSASKSVAGYGKAPKNIKYPDPGLDTGPF
jgi:hypothetical protein